MVQYTSRVSIPSGFACRQAKPYTTQVTPTPWLFQVEKQQLACVCGTGEEGKRLRDWPRV